MGRIRTKSQVGYVPLTPTVYADSIATTESIEVLEQARTAWDSLANWRKRARRNREYYFGNQWQDKVLNPDYRNRPNQSKYITEEESIIMQGKTPLKNNMLRQLGKALIGQFANGIEEPVAVASDRNDQTLGEMATLLMQYNYTENDIRDIDKRMLERLLVSGVCACKTTHGWNSAKQRRDTWVKDVNPNMMFWDTAASDLRQWDISLIGEIHDMTIDELVSFFGKDEQTRQVIRQLYGNVNALPTYGTIDNLSSERYDNADFLLPTDPSLCRVIEVWRKERKQMLLCHDWGEGRLYKIECDKLWYVENENRRRISEGIKQGLSRSDIATIEVSHIVDEYWVARWLTPRGEVLRQIYSPYNHNQHPYTLCLYPYYDGEIHSFIEDIIDQQRYINRLITMYDFMLGASAKGVLLVPEDSIPDGVTAEDFAEAWVRYNGVIVYKAKVGAAIPTQVSSNSTNIGVMEMLHTQLQLITEISGVSGALQGKQAKSGTASSLYAQESQNSANNLVDLLTTFTTFRERRDKKMLQTDLQFFDYARYINLVGSSYSEEAKNYDPDRAKDVSFDLRICESVDTPAYRQQANNLLIQLFQQKAITIKELLEVGAFPYADKLRAILEREERASMERMMAQQAFMAQQQAQGKAAS